MSKAPQSSPPDQLFLRPYPAPWKGIVVLACRKCQKKLKRSSPRPEAANLKKALKRRTTSAGRLHILQVSCLKLCPGGGVAVCTPRQFLGNKCSIVRTPADIDLFHAQSLTDTRSA